MDSKSMGEGIKWMMRALFVLGVLSSLALLGSVAMLAGWIE